MNTEHTETGLAASYDEPTFAPSIPVALPPPAQMTGNVGNLVQLANDMNLRRADAEKALIRAGQAHLAYSCLVGACVQQVYNLSAVQRFNFRKLFASKGETAKDAKFAGFRFAFSYEHANRCRKLYMGIYQRMLEKGGYTPETLERVIGEHVQALIAGAYGETESMDLFAPYLSTDSLRQELLALFPPAPPTAGETVAAAVNGQPAFTGWDAQRAQHKTEFQGYLACIDTYIDKVCMFTTDADREEQAQKLELAARRLRNAKTQPDLPGLPA